MTIPQRITSSTLSYPWATKFRASNGLKSLLKSEPGLGSKMRHSSRSASARVSFMYIFFGTHTANAVLSADRLEKKEQAKAA